MHLCDNAEYLADATGDQKLLRLSCSLDFSAGDLTKPDTHWIQICPAGLHAARDGRAFTFGDLASICSRTEVPLLVDWEHLSERPEGSTKAAGWISEMYPDETGDRFGVPGIYARVEWTPQGLEDVSTLAYRFISPVILVSGAEAQAVQLISVALTNTPALHMSSIDSVRARFNKLNLSLHSKERMIEDNLKQLCAVLDVEESTDDTAIIAASTQLKALCATLSTELQEARTSASTVQAELAALKEATFQAEVDAVLALASKEGRVTPALASKYKEFCSDAKALTFFKDVVLPSLPALCEQAPPLCANVRETSPCPRLV